MYMHIDMELCIYGNHTYGEMKVCLSNLTSIYVLSYLYSLLYMHTVMKPTPKIEENRNQCLRNQPLRGGNLQYIS